MKSKTYNKENSFAVCTNCCVFNKIGPNKIKHLRGIPPRCFLQIRVYNAILNCCACVCAYNMCVRVCLRIYSGVYMHPRERAGVQSPPPCQGSLCSRVRRPDPSGSDRNTRAYATLVHCDGHISRTASRGRARLFYKRASMPLESD